MTISPQALALLRQRQKTAGEKQALIGGLLGLGRAAGRGLGTGAGGLARSFGRVTGLAEHGARRQLGSLAGKGRQALRTGETTMADDLARLNELSKQMKLPQPSIFERPIRVPGGSHPEAYNAQRYLRMRKDPQIQKMLEAADPQQRKYFENALNRLAGREVAPGQTVQQTLDAAAPKLRDYAAVGGTGAALGGLGYLGATGGPEQLPSRLPAEQPNAFERGMGGVGDWLGQNVSPSLGNWVQQNPYLSAAGGAGGMGLLLMLILSLLNRNR